MMLTIVIVLSTLILLVSGQTAEEAKQSAWIVPIFASLAGVVTLWLVTQLGRRFPSYTLPQYSQLILGKFLGKLLGVCYLTGLLFGFILVTRQFTEFVAITLLPETLPLVLSFGFVLVGVYASTKGLEVIARMNQFIFPLLMIALLVGAILSWAKMDLDRLLPLLEDGIMPVIVAARTSASWYGEVIFIAFIFPQLNKPQEIFQKGLLGLMVATGIMVLLTLITISIYGYALTSTFAFPSWSVVRYLEFGKYVQRLESFLGIIWIGGMLVKFAILIYLTSLTSTQLFPIKYKTALYILAGIIVIGSVYSFKNIEQLIIILTSVWPLLGLIGEIVFPFLLYIVAILRGKKEGDLQLES